LQYRPGHTRCSECGFELGRGAVPALGPPGSEVVVVFEGHLDETEAAQAAMATAGIESRIAGRSRRGMSVNHGLSQLQVRAEDEDAAKEALRYPNG
jgi:hypothetical protein